MLLALFYYSFFNNIIVDIKINTKKILKFFYYIRKHENYKMIIRKKIFADKNSGKIYIFYCEFTNKYYFIKYS